jgi:hypothetical protein
VIIFWIACMFASTAAASYAAVQVEEGRERTLFAGILLGAFVAVFVITWNLWSLL